MSSNKFTFIYGGEKVVLKKSKDSYALILSDKSYLKKVENNFRPIEKFHIFDSNSTKLSSIESELDHERGKQEVYLGTHTYFFDGYPQTPYVPTGKIYIEFFSDKDEKKCLELLHKFHLKILKKYSHYEFIVAVTSLSPNPIKVADQLQESRLISIAEPDLATFPIEHNVSLPSGSLFRSQWHLENEGKNIPYLFDPQGIFNKKKFKKGADGKIVKAWNALKNKGSDQITIAIIDTNFYAGHSMYAPIAKLLKTYNADTETSNVLNSKSSHGTKCATVAAGIEMPDGMIGVNPNAKLILIALPALADEFIERAFNFAFDNNADIISSSIGFPHPRVLSTRIKNVINKCVNQGRNGKGMPIFFAAGNANPLTNFERRHISDFANHPSVLTISASDSQDQLSDYPFYGENVFLSGPTSGNDNPNIAVGSVSIEQSGNSYLIREKNDFFSGTSCATPIVAGICSLLLSANPDLTLNQIKEVLSSTADKIDSANAEYDQNGRSIHLGYGRVNAEKAVKKAMKKKPDSKKFIVAAKHLNVRRGPSTSFGIVGILNQDDIVSVVGYSGSWAKIGPEEYIHSNYINIAEKSKGIVTASSLNVRAGGSVSYSKVDVLNFNASVDIYETVNGWLRIGTDQWVSGKYIRIIL